MNRRTVCRSSRRTSRRFDHTPRSALRTNSTLRDVKRNLPSRVRVDVNVLTTRRRVRETTRALVDGDDVVRTPHHASSSSSSPSPSREDGTVPSSPRGRAWFHPRAGGFRGPARGRRTTTRRGTNERSNERSIANVEGVNAKERTSERARDERDARGRGRAAFWCVPLGTLGIIRVMTHDRSVHRSLLSNHS